VGRGGCGGNLIKFQPSVTINTSDVDNIAPNITEDTGANPLKLYKVTLTEHIHALQAERIRFNVKSGGTYANHSV
jgi:hypothetical protein